MRIIITESQYKKILKEEEQKIVRIPSLRFFDNNWGKLQNFLRLKGNPPYSILGDLELRGPSFESLGNLVSVGGSLGLVNTRIESLGNLTSIGKNFISLASPIESLGNLTSVGSSVILLDAQIKSLGNLKSVGNELILKNAPLESFGNLEYVGRTLGISKDSPVFEKYTEEEIHKMVNVGGKVIFHDNI